MNLHQNLIVANGKVITPAVIFCTYNPDAQKYNIKLNNGKLYSYLERNVVWITNPEVLNPENYRIVHNDKELFGITAIYDFQKGSVHYWHICFRNGSERDYEREVLEVSVSCLNNATARNVLNYLRQTAQFTGIRAEDGTNLLEQQYNKLGFVSNDTAISTYIHPETFPPKQYDGTIPIFPFGCNASQFTAVKNALENQFSVIQGPPGTGKTQTILNIIANLLIAGKTVQVVSNNNSATANVLDKLANPKYGLDFLVAPLGNSENKTQFIREQKGYYPETIKSWASDLSKNPEFFAEAKESSGELTLLFSNQERLSVLSQLLQELETEYTHFNEYVSTTGNTSLNFKIRRKLQSIKVLQLWIRCQEFSDTGTKPSFFFKLKSRFIYGIANWNIYTKDTTTLIPFFQELFYTTKRVELITEIDEIKTYLSVHNQEVLLRKQSETAMRYVKSVLYEKYGNASARTVFTEDDLWRNTSEILNEYPVVLSTTFSARSSLSAKALFDYVLIDEASQVDVATGALALSCAKNAVIVGDAKQLPNVITEDNRKVLQAIFDSYHINNNYNFAEKSFLQSICDVVPDIPKTLLREHYRCHPKIANFINQKFYNGNLLIMTQDTKEENVISVVKTVVGNHKRGHINLRQIEVIKEEIMPYLSYTDEEIGIITPYNDQVASLQHAFSEKQFDIATVHKFQGREKDAIIISTVDDEITSFSDDPNLMNVAVSRAKKSLHLVVSGNEQPKNSNISDLVDYIEYNNFSVTESKVNSVFDFLYRQYTESRLNYLKAYNRISTYDSENLMYALIQDVLHENNFTALEVICHQPLKMLIRDFTPLDDEDRLYALHNATHLDFLVYNRISKKPTLAIEVDGFHFHKEGTPQSFRDIKKDRILAQYGIPLLRFATNGSGEKEKLVSKLREIVNTDQDEAFK